MAQLETLTAEATEQELIRIAQQALSRCNWVVGQCAAQWTQRYARGRTDGDFAQLVGLSPDQVFQRRRVWETFGDVFEQYASLRWSHFYVALNWDDAPECLQWADENGATIAEMRAWRRASRGEDLTAPADDSSMGDDPSIGRLTTIPAEVRDPDDERATRSWEREPRGSDEEEGAPFVPTAASANREIGSGDGSDYAPFRRDAGSAPPKERGEEYAGEEKPAGQIAKRVIGTLERIVTVLTPQIMAAFRSLPEKDRNRLVAAVRQLSERVEVLEGQRV